MQRPKGHRHELTGRVGVVLTLLTFGLLCQFLAQRGGFPVHPHMAQNPRVSCAWVADEWWQPRTPGKWQLGCASPSVSVCVCVIYFLLNINI